MAEKSGQKEMIPQMIPGPEMIPRPEMIPGREMIPILDRKWSLIA